MPGSQLARAGASNLTALGATSGVRHRLRRVTQMIVTGAVAISLALAGSATASAQKAVEACSDTQTTLSAYQLPKEKQFEIRPLSKFFVGEQYGDLLLRHPLKDQIDNKTVITTAVRVFANSRSLRAQAPQPGLDKPPAGFEGFGSGNSTLARFEVPAVQAFPLWHKREFLVVACNGGDLQGWGVARVAVTDRPFVISVSLIATVALYILFALAVWRIRSREHPLQAKYPAYAPNLKFGPAAYIFNPVHLTANAFNNASVQKFQILLFSFLVAGMLLCLILEVGNLSDLSGTVVILLGISGVGAALGQAANRDRLDFSNWAWLVNKEVLPIYRSRPEGPRWGDLVLSHREFDMYKFQNLIFSIVVAVALLVAGEGRLASFEIPQTLLGILGLSQGVFIAGILVGTPSVADLDRAITKLRELEKTMKLAKAGNTDVDDKGALQPSPPAGTAAASPPAPKARQMYDDQADLVEKMIESTLEIEISRAKLDPS